MTKPIFKVNQSNILKKLAEPQKGGQCTITGDDSKGFSKCPQEVNLG